MRSKVPFPSGPGDWRYDPTTGRLIDASKTPPEEVETQEAAAPSAKPAKPTKVTKRAKR